jgi:hypothetical protein
VFAGIAQFFGFLALSQYIIEYDDVGPVDMRFPVIDFIDKTIGYRSFLLGLDEISNVVSFAGNCPCDIADQPIDGNEQKFSGARSHQCFTRYSLITTTIVIPKNLWCRLLLNHVSAARQARRVDTVQLPTKQIRTDNYPFMRLRRQKNNIIFNRRITLENADAATPAMTNLGSSVNNTVILTLPLRILVRREFASGRMARTFFANWLPATDLAALI